MRYQVAVLAISGLALTGAIVSAAESGAKTLDNSGVTTSASKSGSATTASKPAPAPAPVISAPTSYYGVPIVNTTGGQKRKSGA